MGATSAIAEFIVNTSIADFPAASTEKAKKAIADTFAVIIAGAGFHFAQQDLAIPVQNGHGCTELM